MAPEIIQKDQYTFPADIWALGIVLYEMCALKLPFKAKVNLEMYRQIKKDEPAPIPDIYSSELKVLLKALLEK